MEADVAFRPVLGSLRIAVVTFTILGTCGCNDERAPDPAETALAIRQRDQVVKRLEQQAAHELSDPNSARFRKLELFDHRVLCGQVRQRKEYEASDGYRWFVSWTYFDPNTGEPSDTGTAMIDGTQPAMSETFRKGFDKFCKGEAELIDTDD